MSFLVLPFLLYGVLLLADAFLGTLWDLATMPPDDRVALVLMAVDAMKVGG
jgi:hypothetical protein